jgi:hypothetical protein
MLRVLGTIQNSEFADTLQTEQNKLTSWIKEIHAGMYPFLVSYHTAFLCILFTPRSALQDSNTGLFLNYASQPLTSSPNFLDASSTALLASTVYRLSLLRGEHAYIPLAEKSRKALSATEPNSSWQLVHFTSEGWLKPVVNPYAFPHQGSNSPEGQAFVVEMQAAWRDWVADGSKGENGAISGRMGVAGRWAWASVHVWVVVWVGTELLV